jgi:CDP-6-deoxy-D-xylo-4-hexulose-3-dehydrase
MVEQAAQLRAEILALTTKYFEQQFAPQPFFPGSTPVPCAGKVLDAPDICHLVEASLDGWLTTGRFAAEFEKRFARFFGLRAASLVNSGSSANLVAFSALTSPKLGERQIKPGDEVITVAAGFPTTVNPALQHGCVPIFVDVTLPTYQIDITRLDEALSPKTKAVMVAHTLGNPFPVREVAAWAKAHNLWLVEDCCDAVGSTYDGQMVGSFGDLATTSFYPAHHITMGEGGAVLTNQPLLKTLAESFRDWGRDCWCEPGHDNTCGKRYDWQLGELPCGYDHKFTYSHIGYNLKLTDMQAAIGVSQLAKLPGFIAARRSNFAYLRAALAGLEEFFLLPEATPNSDPSWFGFPLTVRLGAPFDRTSLLRYLEERKVGTRLLFGGDLTRQPAYQGLPFRVVGELANTQTILGNSFWIGVYPGLSRPMLDYAAGCLREFVRRETADLKSTLAAVPSGGAAYPFVQTDPGVQAQLGAGP